MEFETHKKDLEGVLESVKVMIEESALEAEVSAKSYRLLFEAVSQAVDEGHIRSEIGFQADEAAFSFWSLVHGIAMLQVSYQRTLSVEFDRAEKIALRALAEGLSIK